MNWLERRRMNLTRVAVIRATWALASKGMIHSGMDKKQLAQVVAAYWLTTEASVPTGDPAIDWDAIIAFIEQLIPLILKIIEIIEGLTR